jgi:N-acetylglucosaminyldiphosphoundecaprenol N-acetyl-beta-D-mannosaminyltransferase
MIKRLEMLGFNFYSAKDVKVIAEFVHNDVVTDEGIIPLMVTPNVDQIVRLDRKENHPLREKLKNARWILPDGQPVIALSRIKFGKEKGLEARLTGSDFFPEMWGILKNDESRRVLFVLPREDLGDRFVDERPNTVYYAPPFFKLENKDEFEEVMTHVMSFFDETPPEYVFVGLGFPKQENIALEIFNRLKAKDKKLPKTFLLGASFEFYWGTKKRAPMFYQKAGIEFVHRIITEPRRLAKRYLWDDLPFLGIAISELRKKK